MTMGAVTADQLQRLAFDVFDPGWNGTKFAMVAEDDDVYGMARVYAAVADETGAQQRRAFRTLEAAMAWLEEPDRPESVDDPCLVSLQEFQESLQELQELCESEGRL